MGHTPNSLTDAFPDKLDELRALRGADPHFDRLSLDYEAVNHAIHRAETDIEPTDDFHLEDMRKQRLRLLDEIARRLAEV